MTILVTGSAGHLGEALMRTFATAGEAAVGLDLRRSPHTRLVGSITDPLFVRQAMTGVTAVVHAATLHKPHVGTHSAQNFVDANVTGTLTLLEAAIDAGVEKFVFTSTTSAFGSALRPARDAPAAWVTEDTQPIPRNIYGVTKLAAESLVELFHRQHGLAAIILRTSRFFPEADDDIEVRGAYDPANVQANELLYRRADIEDVVSAHLCALARAPGIGFGRYIVSATTPFAKGDIAELRRDAPGVLRRVLPDYEAVYARLGWRMFPGIDRVYVNARARTELGWRPQYDFGRALARSIAGEDLRSELAVAVGYKGYHDESFAEGPYPVAP